MSAPSTDAKAAVPFIQRLLIDSLLFIFGILPESLAIAIGRALGWTLRVCGFRKHIVESQINWVYRRRPDAERAAIIKAHYRHVGLLFIEMLRLPKIGDLSTRCVLHDREHLDQALADGKGAFLLMGHTGNWELGSVMMAQAGFDCLGVVKEMKSAAGNYLLTRMRDDNGVKTTGRRQVFKEIIRALKDGKAVAFVLDQNMTADEGIFVPFFGCSASTTPSLAVFAERSQRPIIPVHSWRDPDDHRHHIQFLPPIEHENHCDDRDDNRVANTYRFNIILEKMINTHPEQWLWLHKRWKTREHEGLPSPFDY